MLKQIYQSAPLPYRKPEDLYGIPNGTGLQSLYNGYLVTPPRIYAEEFNFPLSLFSKKENTANSISTITLIGVTASIYWPGYEMLAWKFDGTTGAFIDYEPIIGDILTGSLHLDTIIQGYNNTLWASYNVGEIHEYDPTTFALLQTFDAAHFGRAGTASPLVDKVADICIMPAEGGQPAVVVYKLSTGETIRRIGVSGAPANLCCEDTTRAYVMSTDFVLNLFDYSTGDVISTVRCPTPASASYVMLTWDRILRRILTFAKLPNETDGASTSRVLGYYPIGRVTHLVAPIPLKTPRRGRQVPVLLRAVGDTGEPLAGALITCAVTDQGSINRQAPGSDGNGDSILSIGCTAQGYTTITATTDNGL